MKQIKRILKSLLTEKETGANPKELHEIVFKNKDIDSCTDSFVWNCILNLAQTILSEEDTWHFFYEDYYYIIRCPFRLVDDVSDYLFKKGFSVELKGVWIDSSEIVEKYKHLFTQLFHINTMFAVQELDMEQIWLVHDRVSHCFLNNQFFNAKSLRDEVGDYTWEIVMLLDYANSRVRYNAAYSQRIKNNLEKGEE